MRHRAFAFLLLSLPTIGIAQIPYHPAEVGRKHEKAKSKPVKLFVWSAKPGADAQLDTEKVLFGWSIRPPRGFAFTQKSVDTNQIFIFQGNPRPDTSSPVLWVLLGDVRGTTVKQSKDEMVMDQYMIELHKDRDDWKAMPTQTGMVRGRKYIRRHWSATQAFNGVPRRLHGTIYVTVTGAKFAAVMLQDSDPDATATMAVMETAALSFHKR